MRIAAAEPVELAAAPTAQKAARRIALDLLDKRRPSWTGFSSHQKLPSRDSNFPVTVLPFRRSQAVTYFMSYGYSDAGHFGDGAGWSSWRVIDAATAGAVSVGVAAVG
ncbi:hypothetical protein ACW9HL_27780, partial [Nocardia gipuzkoensis]